MCEIAIAGQVYIGSQQADNFAGSVAFSPAAAVIGGFPYAKSGVASDILQNLNARYCVSIEISETKGTPYAAFFTFQTKSFSRGRHRLFAVPLPPRRGLGQ
jgi:hypothetical protein